MAIRVETGPTKPNENIDGSTNSGGQGLSGNGGTGSAGGVGGLQDAFNAERGQGQQQQGGAPGGQQQGGMAGPQGPSAAEQAAAAQAAAEAARKAANIAKRQADEKARQEAHQKQQQQQKQKQQAATRPSSLESQPTQKKVEPQQAPKANVEQQAAPEAKQSSATQAKPVRPSEITPDMTNATNVVPPTVEQIESAHPVPMKVNGETKPVNPSTGEIVDKPPRPRKVFAEKGETIEQQGIKAKPEIKEAPNTESLTPELEAKNEAGEKARQQAREEDDANYEALNDFLNQYDYASSRRPESDQSHVQEQSEQAPAQEKPEPQKQDLPAAEEKPAEEQPEAEEQPKQQKPGDEKNTILNARPTDKMQKSIENTRAWLETGYFAATGMEMRDGKYQLSDRVQQKLDQTMAFFDLRPGQEHFLFEAAAHMYGVSPDRAGELFKSSMDQRMQAFDEIVVDSWDTMMKNTINPNIGQPFAYTMKGKEFAGVKRFTVPVVRNELAVALCNGRPNNMLKMRPHELNEFGMNEWVNKVRPYMDAVANPDQKQVLRDMVDAVEQNNKWKRNLSGRIANEDFTAAEAYDEFAGYASVFHDAKDLFKANAAAKKVAAQYAELEAEQGRKIVRDPNGNLVTVRDIVENPGSWGLRMVVQAARATALFNPILGVSAVIEHAESNVTNILAGQMLRKAFGTKPITETTREIAKTEPVKDALDDLMRSLASGNRTQIMAYLAAGGKLGKGNMATTMKEMVEGMTPAEKAKYYAEFANNKYSAAGHQIASGRWALKNADAIRFVEALQFKMQKMDGSNVTPESFEKMFRADPVGMIEQMMQRPEGVDALLFAMDNTIGGANIYTEWFQRQMAKSAIADFAVAALVSKFVTYGINLTGKIMPMTHTFNYLVTKGIQNGTNNKTQVENLTFGGNDSFSRGLLQNLIIDIAWLGTRGGILILALGIIQNLGVEPPDDEEDWKTYGEWKIGGVAIKENWMMRDVLGFVTPVAMAIHAGVRGGDAFAVFSSGAMQTINGLPWVKMSSFADMILNFDTNLVQSQEELEKSWGEEAPTARERAIVGAQTWGLTMIANFFEPPISRMLYSEAGNMSRDNLTSSTAMIYTPDPNDDPDATMRTTWADAQFRATARKYPLVADILNLAQGIGNSGDGRQQTGYRKEQMPLVEISDPVQSYWRERFTIEDGASEEDKMTVVNDVLDIVRNYDSPEAIAADGIVIPYTARQAAYDYLFAQINAIDNQRSADFATPGMYTQNGLSYEENKLARDQRVDTDRQQKNILYAMKDRLSDNRIPYSPMKYNQWETDWNARYVWNDSGEAAGAFDYLLNPGKVEKEWYASGDHKTSIIPWLEVDDRYNGYASQTPAGWWNENLSSPERMKELYGDATLETGMFAGENVYELAGGDAAMFGDGGWKNQPTAGQRALVPVIDYSDKPKLLDGNRDDAWRGNLGDLGKKSTEDTQIPTNSLYNRYGGSGGSYYRSGGGGGGSSYKPNIYSKPAYSLNADKPATMYAKVPYSSRFDYLRPGFETKGSREAYKRQDI